MEETIYEYKKGEHLFHEGDDSKDLYIIQSGTIRIYKTADGKKIPIALATSGNFVGELAFFDNKPRSASAEAATDIKVIKLDQVRLEKEIKRIPSWLLVMIRGIAEHVRETDVLIMRNHLVDPKMAEQFKKFD